MTPIYDFQGQVALVTGAGGGMGLDTARAFAPLILALFALLTAMAEFSGIVRIGEFDGDMGVLSRQPDGFSVKIERGR